MRPATTDDYKSRMKRELRELKSRVGVTDVALHLGYRVDKRAGIGRYVEMVLGAAAGISDRIIISHPNDRTNQTYFRRDGSRGDAATLVKENLGAFNARGRSDWEKVLNVLADMANMPSARIEDATIISRSSAPRQYDPSVYEVRQFAPSEQLPWMLRDRGFNIDTFNAFAPHIVKIRDRRIESFKGFNIGFPYRKAGEEAVEGYEIRGAKGFKSKAAGTNSSTAAWLADFSAGDPAQVRSVVFVESGYDAMAFYQANRLTVDWTATVLVSLGGGNSGESMRNVLTHYRNACAVEAFDNDTAGRAYATRLFDIAAHLNDSPGQRHDTDSRKAPEGFKDWNDVILGKRMEPALNAPSKYDRDANLAHRRALSRGI
ncbi:MAG: toprim domain-containing protein [Candidatus Amulumruptor caecigallinarius]|nr:toprim domain-containing protein [Candidatus Amulumruptor caecigallinarius]MCM1395966.1 toprim domain-containing protein [Candidatus Amulumruptor caecigallinarius]MCM1453001.1 toprim domain-containing protein [bacterium]